MALSIGSIDTLCWNGWWRCNKWKIIYFQSPKSQKGQEIISRYILLKFIGKYYSKTYIVKARSEKIISPLVNGRCFIEYQMFQKLRLLTGYFKNHCIIFLPIFKSYSGWHSRKNFPLTINSCSCRPVFNGIFLKFYEDFFWEMKSLLNSEIGGMFGNWRLWIRNSVN